MFALTQTFTHTTGCRITPLEMEGVGFIFLPKELESHLGYENLPDMVRQSDSFVNGIEYHILKNSKLVELKTLLKKRNTIPEVAKSINRAPSLIVLTEPGLYTVMFLSRKSEAKVFRRWVTCEVLPSIRKTGVYKVNDLGESTFLPKLAEKINSLEQTCEKFIQIFAKQEQFQQYSLRAFERIEAILAESLPHDMFEGWKKIRNIVEDMTRIYGLSETEVKRYIQELCQSHDVQLPAKAFLESESPFHDAQEIAAKMGIYSSTHKPHSRLVSALVFYLELNQDRYCHKYGATIKYSDMVIPHIWKWLQDRKFPKKIELECRKLGKVRKFQAYYRSTALHY